MTAASLTEELRPTQSVGLLAVVTAAVLLLSTRYGIGVSHDSTAYLGLRAHDVGHAPLYSWLMRLGAALPLDVTLIARLYHTALYAGTAVLSWRLLRAATGGSLPAWAGALLIAFTGQALAVYSMALSEPTFVLLVVLAFAWLSSWVDTRAPRFFIGAAIAAALAMLARYPGVALVATGTLTVLVAGGGALRPRATRALLFATVGLAPALGWMAYVAWVSGTAGGRNAALTGTADAETFYDGVLEAARFLLPTEFPEGLRVAALAVALALLAAATIAFYRRRVSSAAPAPVPSSLARHPHRFLPLILLVFAALYSAVIVLGVLVEPYLPILDRYLYPAYVTLVLLGAVTAPALARTAATRHTVAVAVALFVALSVVRTAKVAGEGFEHGWGYASDRWRSSAAVAYVSALPSTAAVYSDDPNALLFLTQRAVREVPHKIVRRLGAANAAFDHEVAAMREQLQTTQGVVVIFDRERGVFDMPALPDLSRAMPLREQARFADATVYALAAPDEQRVAGGY